MRLRLRKCRSCPDTFNQRTWNQTQCLKCRVQVASYPSRPVPEVLTADEHARLDREEHWRKWLAGQFESMLGDPALNPIVLRLLGRKTEAA